MNADRLAEIERTILAAALVDPALWPQVAVSRSDDWSLDSHRLIYQRERDVLDVGRSLDYVILTAELEAHGELDRVGGAAYIAELAQLLTAGLARACNIGLYVNIVRNQAKLRRIIHNAETVIARASAPDADAITITEDLYNFAESEGRVAAQCEHWRALFKSRSEMDQGEMPFLIEGILPEGIGLIGALASSGKTWFALSLAKALSTGSPFLGRWPVPETVPVLYLIPEASEKAFRARLDRMRIPDDTFLCRTVKDGVLRLDDVRLLAAVKAVRPTVFLDTAIRFSTAKDENSATENRALMDAFCQLISSGARAVIGLHHSPKSTASVEEMTLENALRGTGDLGAMADVVYGLKCVDQGKNEIRVRCVKARDFDYPAPFHITARPHINEIGDFVITTEPAGVESPGRGEKDQISRLADIISQHPWRSQRTIVALAVASGMQKSRAEELLKRDANVPWIKKKGPRNAILYGPTSECRVSTHLMGVGTGQ